MPISMKVVFFGLALALACFTGKIVDRNLRGEIRGLDLTVALPGDLIYDDARLAFNLRYDLHPAAIFYPKSPQDVANIVRLGASLQKQVSARSGGHSYIANGLGGQDGAFVVDLSNLKKIAVDHTDGTAVIQTGNRLGDVAQALNAQGRAIPHGVCPYVGIGGHASFGGFGFTSRMWGLTIDRIISAEVVLANGTIVTASNATNPDLFWAMRGAGPSFGITTSFTFVTEPIPSSALVFQYNWTHVSTEDLTRIISQYQIFTQNETLPSEFDVELNIRPGDLAGSVTAEMLGGWYGDPSDLDGIVQPLLDSIPIQPNVTVTGGTWIESLVELAGGSLNTTLRGTFNTFYVKSLMTPEDSPMSDNAIGAFSSYMTNEGHKTSTVWFTHIELYGGHDSAINAIPLDATSFAYRSSLFTIQFHASSSDSKPPYPDEGFSFLDGMVSSIVDNSPSSWNYGAYTNYVDDMLSNSSALYYASQHKRLQSIKRDVDPSNVFHFPTSIMQPQ